ncbi:MAG: hypothetical protein QM765_33695 [Myxococcales bacterium]
MTPAFLKTALWKAFAPERVQGTDDRLYRGFALGLAVLLLGVSLPLNALQGLPLRLLAPVAAGGLASALLFALSLRGQRHDWAFLGLALGLLTFWFFAYGGSWGSTPMHLFAIVGLSVVLFRGRGRVAALCLVVGAGLALFVAERLFPQLVSPIPSDAARTADLVVGVVVCGAASGMLFWTVAVGYRTDLRHIGEANEQLRASLADVEALRGLLPVCPSCKKIRDDAGHWQALERYLQEHVGTHVTHGICPSCARKWDEEGKGQDARPESGGVGSSGEPHPLTPSPASRRGGTRPCTLRRRSRG